jgi:hypothetical protein
MKTTTFLAMVIVLLTVSSTSCAQTRNASDKFEVGEFTAIEASMVGNVVITQSNTTSVTAEGSEEMLDKLDVRMNNGKLVLEMDDRHWKRFGRNSGKLTIHIATPTLTEIDFDGVGNINIEGTFSTPQLVINSEGVGNLTANNLQSEHVKISSEGVGNTIVGGKADKVEIDSEGVGNVEADKLIARETIVSSEGVGNVSCYASEYLKVRSQGIGNVRYFGKPKETDLSKDGIGKIRAGN